MNADDGYLTLTDMGILTANHLQRHATLHIPIPD